MKLTHFNIILFSAGINVILFKLLGWPESKEASGLLDVDLN